MNILVRAPNWLGDIVMALPAIETIRRHYPEARLTVAAPPAFAPLCAAAPGVDAVLPLAKGRGRAARAERTRAIQAGRFDLAILLTNSFASALDPWQAGIPERWGFRADWRGRLLTRAIERPRKARAARAGRPPESADAAPKSDAHADVAAAGSGPVESVPAALEPDSGDAAAAAAIPAAAVAAAATAAPLDLAVAAEVPPRGRHHSEYYLALTSALGMRPDRRPPPLVVAAEAASRARTLLAEAGWDGVTPLVAVAPGAAYGFAKRWPPERMAAVIDRLAARGLSAVLVGAPADRGSARAVESALVDTAGASDPTGQADPAGTFDGPADRPIPVSDRGGVAAATRAPTATEDRARGRCFNLVGQTDLPALMGLFGACVAVLSNDSGAMHLASAVGRPVVAVFGPTDDVATAPLGPHASGRHDVWCRPCLLRECPIDHRCMRGVSADAVFDALMTTIAAAA
jgi:ADP-heptose:LPS heptosyltransferase